MDQRVVHRGQGAWISTHKAVLGSDVPCFQCTPLVEIRVSVYHCGTAPVNVVTFIDSLMKTPGLGLKRLFLDLYLSPKNDWLELFPERLCMMLPSHSEVFNLWSTEDMYSFLQGIYKGLESACQSHCGMFTLNYACVYVLSQIWFTACKASSNCISISRLIHAYMWICVYSSTIDCTVPIRRMHALYIHINYMLAQCLYIYSCSYSIKSC